MKKYFIILSVLLISCSGKFPFDLKKGYFLDYDSNGYICILNKNNSLICNYNIIKINNSSKYIILEVKPINLIITSVNGKQLTNYDERRKLINSSKLKEYWIVDKTKNLMFDKKNQKYINVYGPFNKIAFNKKKKELGIPNTFKLLSINELLKNYQK